MSTDGENSSLIDELEMGELAVEFEGQEPWDVLEWAIERFGNGLALSTAFQEGDVALDRHGLPDRSRGPRVLDRHGPPAAGDVRPDRAAARALPGPAARAPLAGRGPGPAARRPERPESLPHSVENRLLCCNVRKVQPLTRALAGLDAWVTGLRRDQWATRSDIRKVEIDHDHGAIVKLNPLAEWTEDEVWDYLRENDVPTHALYEQGYTSIGCAPCTRPVAKGEPVRAGRWWWETDAPKECGMHCAIETGGFEHELHAIVGEGAHE